MCVPRGITTPDKPNISSTIWRTLSDQKQRVYYYESTFSPSVVWVNFADLDFGPASSAWKLQLDGEPDRAGNQTREFLSAEPCQFCETSEPQFREATHDAVRREPSFPSLAVFLERSSRVRLLFTDAAPNTGIA